jgi:hypothetical protein
MNNTKYDLSCEQINKILIQANRIPFKNILPPLLNEVLEVEGYITL